MSLGLSVRELVTRAREVFASCNAAVPLQLENMTASELVDLIYKTATTAATASAGSISAANKKKPQQKKRQRGGVRNTG